MSTFRCEVVPVVLDHHPNADSLSIVRVFDFVCCVRTADWQGVDRGVYIPVDAVVPDTAEFAFLEGHRRIKAKRLRGVFSMGLLIPAREGWQIGDDVTAEIGAVKYDPDQFTDAPSTSGEDAPAPPGLAPTYTDIENLRRYRNVLKPGERVIVTEKIHGANARYTLRDGVLHCGSRTRWKRSDSKSAWWKVAPTVTQYLGELPEGAVLFGEVYGQVQDLKYGVAAGEVKFRAFDCFDPVLGRYVDHDLLAGALPPHAMVPVLYDGPFDAEVIAKLAEEDSVVDGCGGIREGVVVRPAVERWEHMGRVILKLVSQRFLLRKGA